MTAPVLAPVRWWRDDATRYQSRPLVGACRTWAQPVEEFVWDCPRPPDLGLLRALNAAITERLATAVAITPIEMVTIEARQFTPEEQAEMQRAIDEAFARGDFKWPEPVFLLCTLSGQSLEESI